MSLTTDQIYDAAQLDAREPRLTRLLEAVCFELTVQEKIVEDAQQRAEQADVNHSVLYEEFCPDGIDPTDPDQLAQLADAEQVAEDMRELAELEEEMQALLDDARTALSEFIKKDRESYEDEGAPEDQAKA